MDVTCKNKNSSYKLQFDFSHLPDKNEQQNIEDDFLLLHRYNNKPENWVKKKTILKPFNIQEKQRSNELGFN